MEAISSAIAVIKKRLESHIWQQGDRLPTLSDLAEICSVSRTTMWQAIGRLKKDGLLHATRGGAIYAGQPGMVRLPVNRKGRLWERLKDRLGTDVLSGAFVNEQLPPMEKLSLQYNADPRTLGRALGALMHEGIIVKEGARIFQVHRRKRVASGDMILIAAGTRKTGISSEDPRTRAVVEAFERECTRLGCQCQSHGFDARSAKGYLDIIADLKDVREPKGFIVNFWNPWDADVRNRWFDLLSNLISRKVPVIVIDQAGDLILPGALVSSSSFRMLRICGERSGEMVADALLRAGHRHVAFVSGSIGPQWVQDRFNGVKRYYSRYGGSQSKVDLFTYGTIDDQNILILGMLNLTNREIRNLYQEEFTEKEILDLQQKMDKIRKKEISVPIENSDTALTLRPLAKCMANLSRHRHNHYAYESIFERILHIAGDSSIDLYLQPFFRKIFETCTADAWVCCDPKSAISALSFLENSRKKVPEDIAVIGFENWREVYEKQLSTYDFNMHGMVQQALVMILNEKSLKSRPVVSEVEGYVVERRTTLRHAQCGARQGKSLL